MKGFVVVSLVAVALTAFTIYNMYDRSPKMNVTYGDRLADIADQVNAMNTTWTATVYPRHKLLQSAEEAKAFLGSYKKTEAAKQRYADKAKTYEGQYTAPASFNSRTQWPNCTSLFETRDQSNCGSCWAVSSGSAMSDRLCIESGQKDQTRISETDILSCCTSCGDGCDGGEEDQAFAHWVSHGYSTGGPYNNKDYCKPYPFEPCAHHVKVPGMKSCGGAEYPTPRCEHKCSNSSYGTDYSADIHKGTEYNTFHGAKDIAEEISRHGPVVTGFTVYEDFMTYKSGIYRHVTGSDLGGHAVRIIGYGSENGNDYWIVTNSWNEHWGEEGIFRMTRGENHCDFERDVVSGHTVPNPHS